IGTASPAADAEVMALGKELYGFLGIKGLELQINSIGCPECRAKYRTALQNYFSEYKDRLCETCLGRLDKNPMRILDCKSPVCSEIAAGAPVMLDYLCDDCKAHFEAVKKYLDAMGVEYKINPTIVRGLDYYTRTVFEFVSTEIGAQGTVCGGGRYDGLVEELGGSKTPALGFAVGLERLMLLMDAQSLPYQEEPPCELYIASMGEKATLKAAQIVSSLRNEGFQAQFDVAGRSVKAQMKFANKLGALFTVVIGDSELESGVIQLKNMLDGTLIELKLEDFEDEFANIAVQQSLSGLQDMFGTEIDLDNLNI
ncbi:MAG: histidine--tRNA ligase, partial [Clostridia bacterium]|nr:histidine--tRNA ligase [Clostridia bacterium]